MTVRYIPQITAIVYELLAAGNKKLTQKKKISLLQILKQTWFNKENQKHWIFSGFWVWILYHNIESKKLNNLVEYWWNNWKKLKTWFAESLEQRFHETGYFFFATRKHCWVQPEGYFKVWGTSKLRDKNRCAYWCQKTCLKPYNNISFQKTISTSQMTSVSNAIFQMKSTEYLVVFCLRKILKNLTLPALTKYYPVLLYNTYKNLRLHEVV